MFNLKEDPDIVPAVIAFEVTLPAVVTASKVGVEPAGTFVNPDASPANDPVKYANDAVAVVTPDVKLPLLMNTSFEDDT